MIAVALIVLAVLSLGAAFLALACSSMKGIGWFGGIGLVLLIVGVMGLT